MERIDIKKSTGLSYRMKEKVYQVGELAQSDKVWLNASALTEKEIAEEVILRGKKSVFKHDGSDRINYSVLSFDNFFAWHFENKSTNGVLSSKFTFKLENLEIVDDDSPATPNSNGSVEWNVELKPG